VLTSKSLNQAVLLGAGSRDGDRIDGLRQAVVRLARAGVNIACASSIWETKPVDLPGDRTVFNVAFLVVTPLPPRELLTAGLAVEKAMGRRRSTVSGPAPDPGPRPIDIDILLYGDRIIDEPGLVIPHPRMHKRRFVLAPSGEIAGDVVHPGLGVTLATLLARCDDTPAAWITCPAGDWFSSPKAMIPLK
jgi:2-amino-4-hydroxy-6-hydroxymethyldihydropteridine diphosphokinase